MITAVRLENFGPLPELNWVGLGRVNLIMGANGSGKTFLLKALYSALRTLEMHGRGQEPRALNEILAEKLYWTFQQDKIGDLVRKGADTPLSLQITMNDERFAYRFGRDTTRSISGLESSVSPRNSNSIFLPPKEVLSLQQVILKSRVQDQEFGFDDTYFDLAQALSTSTSRGKNFEAFASSRKNLGKLLGGKISQNPKTQSWMFSNNRKQKFEIGVTAEGIKKLGILDTLLGNRYLSDESVIFIDEPESALHPKAIEQFMEIILLLAKGGMQFFIATHSYFVIKKLYLLAQQQQRSIPVISQDANGWQSSDLHEGMLDNPIIDESINLYRQEVELALK
ncbi:AAA family ATPase [Pseudomonas sp. LA5]|jgi:AAA15 family ATPase/GTPase|uniref:AAA family ATPase n=1 Tax=Pseudomonas sp. LA5 TaxID=3027850 RepID=UPI00236259C1|nr:ATP-binding protein [Pseudomonas sp. LA5]